MRSTFLVMSLVVFALCGCAAPRATDETRPAMARLAPDPARTPEAVIQVYGARVVGVKGIFGVHTWVAVKPYGESAYTVYEVIGWRKRWGASALVVHQRVPDARWFGAAPELIADQRGPGTDELIAKVDKAAREYPWADEYSAWPGPNSNTFTAWIGRAVPELRLDLPPTAIGKDYSGTKLIGPAPSGSGLQLTLFGLLGLTASPVEGLEVNLLGLTLGVNPFDFSLKLPVLGRVGVARAFGATPIESQDEAMQRE
ncbi:MAG: hypothetical protein A3H35_04060 [Betaproteobacteria bacterium RIFCSPLOWO2_02_FULL_62_17]|nr:MAG: hypothetical protein A3H35_04060 [Betaproteobacteria bacterium RIFCSPLOWO2_02_FULL_62_17]